MGTAQMEKKNERGGGRRAIAKAIIEQYKPTTAEEMQEALRDIFGPMFEAMLQGEMDRHLGYETNDRGAKSTTNRRNGYTEKTVKSEASVESVGWSAVRESGMKIGAGEHNHSEKVIHVAKAKSGTDDEFDFVVDGLGAGIRKPESGGSNNGVKVAFDFLAQLAEHGDPAPLGPGHPLGERTGDLIRPGLESQTKILFEQVGTVELRIGPGQELQLGLLIFREMLRVFEQDIA